jgi:UDP-N-acetyl-D-glucosamine dehydrogenase
LTAQQLATADLVLIITGHHVLDYGLVARHARLIVDTTNVTRGLPTRAELVRLGGGQQVLPEARGLY